MMLRFHNANRRVVAYRATARRQRGSTALQAMQRCWEARNRCIRIRATKALGLPTRIGQPGPAHPADHRARNRVTSVADPFGGSVVIEKMTDEIEQGARDYIDRIDAMGGTLPRSNRGSNKTKFRARRTNTNAPSRRRSPRGRCQPVSPGRRDVPAYVPVSTRKSSGRKSQGSGNLRATRRAGREISWTALEHSGPRLR